MYVRIPTTTTALLLYVDLPKTFFCLYECVRQCVSQSVCLSVFVSVCLSVFLKASPRHSLPHIQHITPILLPGSSTSVNMYGDDNTAQENLRGYLENVVFVKSSGTRGFKQTVAWYRIGLEFTTAKNIAVKPRVDLCQGRQ